MKNEKEELGLTSFMVMNCIHLVSADIAKDLFENIIGDGSIRVKDFYWNNVQEEKLKLSRFQRESLMYLRKSMFEVRCEHCGKLVSLIDDTPYPEYGCQCRDTHGMKGVNRQVVPIGIIMSGNEEKMK